jgi:hypothetical protein
MAMLAAVTVPRPVTYALPSRSTAIPKIKEFPLTNEEYRSELPRLSIAVTNAGPDPAKLPDVSGKSAEP